MLIVTGVLFFNKILVFDGLSIKYQGGEQVEEKPMLKFKKNSSDEDNLTANEDERGGILPKLELDNDNDTNIGEDDDIVSTHSNSANCEQEKPSSRSSAT